MPVETPALPLPISDAAQFLGVTAHTLRYYERDGLMLDAVGRTASGHRRYSERDLTWIRLLTRLRATGMPIREIRSYAALVRAGEGNEAQRLDLLRGHRERVLVQLAEVRENLDAIEYKVEVYQARLAR